MSILPVHDAGTEPMACGATTQVRPADVAPLPVSARQEGQGWRAVDCELAEGHDGSHVAFLAAADGGDQWWWLRWASESREAVHIDPCAVEGVNGAYRDDCLLPDGHLGLHSFELRPVEEKHAPPVLQ